MTDATFNNFVQIFPWKFICVSIAFRMRCTIGITFKRNGWYYNNRAFGKVLFKIIVLWFSFCKSKPPSVIMNNNCNMIRIVE